MVSKIITWIKANLMLVICGSLSLLSITAIVLGMVLPDIQQRLDADKSVYSSLETAGSKAANEHGIEELRSKQAEQQRDLKRFLDSASSFKSSPKALLKWKNGDANMLFPQPVPNEPKASDYFLEAAVAQRREFLSKLNANDKPSESDIREYKEALEKIRQRERIERGESPTPKVGMSQPMGAGAGVGAGAKGGFGGNVPGAGGVGGIGGASGAQASEERTGASIQQAHKTYCYANLDAFDWRHQIPEGTKNPEVEALWLSQVSLWIQDDIVQALARLNNEVANSLPEGDRWVAHLPVKQLLYISIGDFMTKAGGPAAGGRGSVSVGGRASGGPSGGRSGSLGDLFAAMPPSDGPAFTKRSASEKQDVVRLAVGMIIETQYLLRVLDEISKSGFYTPLSVEYQQVDPNPDFQDYVYGSAPVVYVRIELEHCILRDSLKIGDKKYIDLMPAAIKAGSYVFKESARPTSPSSDRRRSSY